MPKALVFAAAASLLAPFALALAVLPAGARGTAAPLTGLPVAAPVAATSLTGLPVPGPAAPLTGLPMSGLPMSGLPVVVELFSSEGCSSCPPADAYLAGLDRTQPIAGVTVLALEFHVDYWDRLGWKDPFDSPEFAQRQADYAREKGDRSVFTPEMIVDGDAILPNGDAEAAFKAIRRASREPKAAVQLERTSPSEVTVKVARLAAGPLASEPSSVWLAITESHLQSTVTAGENRGRVLAHAPVVRRLTKLGDLHAAPFEAHAPLHLDPHWAPGSLRAVAFLQASQTKRILGATPLNLD